MLQTHLLLQSSSGYQNCRPCGLVPRTEHKRVYLFGKLRDNNLTSLTGRMSLSSQMIGMGNRIAWDSRSLMDTGDGTTTNAKTTAGPYVNICKFIRDDVIWQLSIQVPDNHDDVIKWKHFPRYWPFVRGIHRSPVNSPHKGQWRGALKFSLICAWTNGWVNNLESGDLRRHRAHYDVIVTIH